MKFSLFITLLEFEPKSTRLMCKGQILGDYNGKELFWVGSEVQNMIVKVIEINHYNKEVTLEVVE